MRHVSHNLNSLKGGLYEAVYRGLVTQMSTAILTTFHVRVTQDVGVPPRGLSYSLGPTAVLAEWKINLEDVLAPLV